MNGLILVHVMLNVTKPVKCSEIENVFVHPAYQNQLRKIATVRRTLKSVRRATEKSAVVREIGKNGAHAMGHVIRVIARELKKTHV